MININSQNNKASLPDRIKIVVSIEFLSICFQLTPLTGVNCTREATHKISC